MWVSHDNHVTYLTAGVPGHTVGLGLLVQQLLGDDIIHKQRVTLINNSQLGTTGQVGRVAVWWVVVGRVGVERWKWCGGCGMVIV